MGMTLVKVAFRRLLTPISDRYVFPKKSRNKFDFILECSDDDRSVSVYGKRYSPILDSIRDDLDKIGYSCLSLAKPGSKYTAGAHGSPVSVFSVVEEIIYQAIKTIEKLLIQKNKYSSNYSKYVYRRLLDSCQPKLVIGIQPSKDLVVLCNQIGMPVVDVLHGYCITPTHHVYGVSAMKNATDDELCSDYIALDKISQSQIERSLSQGSKHARTWSIQSPVLDVSRPFQQAKTKHGNFNKYDKIFLVTLQCGVSQCENNVFYKNCELHPKIHKLIESMKSLNVLFIIKTHPIIYRNARLLSQFISQYSEYNNVVVDSESTLFNLLSLVDVHLTIDSSVVREAACLGIKSMIFSTKDQMFSGDDYMFKPEIENGIAQRVGYESIDDIINELLTVKRITSLPRAYTDQVVSPNTNVYSIINKIAMESR